MKQYCIYKQYYGSDATHWIDSCALGTCRKQFDLLKYLHDGELVDYNDTPFAHEMLVFEEKEKYVHMTLECYSFEEESYIIIDNFYYKEV